MQNITWSVRGYDDPEYTGLVLPAIARFPVVIGLTTAAIYMYGAAVFVTSMIAAGGYWCVESTWNQLTKRSTKDDTGGFVGITGWRDNPRAGRLSTVLQAWLNVLMLPLMLEGSYLTTEWLGQWQFVGFILISFPVLLYAMEVFQVWISLRLFGKRPWNIYEGTGAWFKGSIKLTMWWIWSVVGSIAYFAWPAVLENITTVIQNG